MSAGESDISDAAGDENVVVSAVPSVTTARSVIVTRRMRHVVPRQISLP